MATLRRIGVGAFISTRTAANVALGEAPGPVSATASYGLLTSGVLQINGADGVSGEWRLFGASADYDVRFTSVSGSVPTGVTYGAWLNLATSRVASLSASRSGSVGLTSVSGVVTVEIRNTASGLVLATATITITAEVELV